MYLPNRIQALWEQGISVCFFFMVCLYILAWCLVYNKYFLNDYWMNKCRTLLGRAMVTCRDSNGLLKSLLHLSSAAHSLKECSIFLASFCLQSPPKTPFYLRKPPPCLSTCRSPTSPSLPTKSFLFSSASLQHWLQPLTWKKNIFKTSFGFQTNVHGPPSDFTKRVLLEHSWTYMLQWQSGVVGTDCVISQT